MPTKPFRLVRSDSTPVMDRDFMTKAKAQHTILDAVTDPKSRANLKVGDHVYAIPSAIYQPGIDWHLLPQKCVHTFRITAQDVICEDGHHPER